MNIFVVAQQAAASNARSWCIILEELSEGSTVIFEDARRTCVYDIDSPHYDMERYSTVLLLLNAGKGIITIPLPPTWPFKNSVTRYGVFFDIFTLHPSARNAFVTLDDLSDFEPTSVTTSATLLSPLRFP